MSNPRRICWVVCWRWWISHHQNWVVLLKVRCSSYSIFFYNFCKGVGSQDFFTPSAHYVKPNTCSSKYLEMAAQIWQQLNRLWWIMLQDQLPSFSKNLSLHNRSIEMYYFPLTMSLSSSINDANWVPWVSAKCCWDAENGVLTRSEEIQQPRRTSGAADLILVT